MIKMFKNKKSLLFIILVLSISTIGVTFALWFNNESFDNKFIFANPDVVLEEVFPNNTFTSDNLKLQKEVSVVNKGTASMLVRISYNEFFYDNRYVSSEYAYAYTNIVPYNNIGEVVTKEWVDWDNWIEKDGWYYYKKVLPGGTSVKFLNSVELKYFVNSDEHTYSALKYRLDFNMESVQATPEVVKELWNKDVTIESGNVTWAF